MAQHTLFKITHAAVGVHQMAGVFVAGNGVDGEVAALQVVFQRYCRIGIDHEAAIATAGLALGARQRVFLTGFRVQEHREITTHGGVAQRLHLRGRGADHHPVAVAGRTLQQAVAHGAADKIDLHGGMMAR